MYSSFRTGAIQGRRQKRKFRKPATKRRGRVGRIPRGVKKSYDFLATKLTTQLSSLSIATSGTLNYVFSPSLSNIAAAELSAYQALYDEFKITYIKIWLKPRGNISNLSNTAGGFQLYSVIDHSDSTSLSNVAEALQYDNCKVHSAWKGLKRGCKPTMVSLLTDVSGSPSLQVTSPRWLQSSAQTISSVSYNDPLLAHLGIKLISETNNNSNTIVFDVYETLYVKFRGRK